VTADSTLEDAEERSIVRGQMLEFRRELSGRDRVLFERRWMSEDQPTLKQVGDRFGVSRERARQVEGRLLRRLRPRIEKRLSRKAAPLSAVG
jgi:RNA polymerase sigma-32 factor